MEKPTLTQLRYPIGKVKIEKDLTPEDRDRHIQTIRELPATLREAVDGLRPVDWEQSYRPEGWTIRQLVHHIADSHLNAFVRFKWTLTEDKPRIKVYDQKGWAARPDASSADPSLSLILLEGLHARWTYLLESMSAADFLQELEHPEWGTVNLDQMLSLYGWHSRHHVAHITSWRERERL